MKRQADVPGPWALFLTFRNMPAEWEDNAKSTLTDNLQRNLLDFPKVLEVFTAAYKMTTAKMVYEGNPFTCMSQATAKWLVDRAHTYNIKLRKFSCYHYQRYPEGIRPYSIWKHVLVFEKGKISPAILPTKGTPRQAWMEDDLVTCVRSHRLNDIEEEVLKVYERDAKELEEIEKDIQVLCDLVDPIA